jgi:hypothetical protein
MRPDVRPVRIHYADHGIVVRPDIYRWESAVRIMGSGMRPDVRPVGIRCADRGIWDATRCPTRGDPLRGSWDCCAARYLPVGIRCADDGIWDAARCPTRGDPLCGSRNLGCGPMSYRWESAVRIMGLWCGPISTGGNPLCGSWDLGCDPMSDPWGSAVRIAESGVRPDVRPVGIRCADRGIWGAARCPTGGNPLCGSWDLGCDPMSDPWGPATRIMGFGVSLESYRW